MKNIAMVATGLAAMVLACVMAAGQDTPGAASAGPARQAEPRHVDIAICLDTSNSMDGLIASAKQKLWAVVSELATAKPHPRLRVALYQYGNNGLDAKTGWVQKVCDLTGDLDTVYGKLFGLTTHGGTEYVARVIRDATAELAWDADKNALRIIFVAGNEPATQDGSLKLQEVCAAAAGKGIIVNTIFCGSNDEGARTGWSDAARWADGRYASIDQDRGTVVITTPYDQKLVELGADLNKTYVAYGKGGASGAANQAAQDGNAGKLGAPAAAERAGAKASVLYDNSSWDLVDAAKKKDFDIAKVKEEDLPDNLRKMTVEQRAAYVKDQGAQRARTQSEIQDLNKKRDEFVKQEMARKGLSDGNSFDAALRSAVREQASAKGFAFEKPATTATAPATAPATLPTSAPAGK